MYINVLLKDVSEEIFAWWTIGHVNVYIIVDDKSAAQNSFFYHYVVRICKETVSYYAECNKAWNQRATNSFLERYRD